MDEFSWVKIVDCIDKLIEYVMFVDLLEDWVLECHTKIGFHELELEVDISRIEGLMNVEKLDDAWVV